MRVNGSIGLKEPGESIVGAMVCEFREETGLMRAGGLAPNMERYLDMFCDDRVVQTYGEASCWDDVIKHKADLRTIGDFHF